MNTLKPMLGTSIERSKLEATLARIPLLASYKLDGIRALVRDGVVLSRSLKPIPNTFVQYLFGVPAFEGFDGELIVGRPTAPDVFRVTTSGVMSEDGDPNVRLYVFDLWNMPCTPFHQRVHELKERCEEELNVRLIKQASVQTLADVDAFSDEALAKGYEGIVLRSSLGLYKFGRSTVREAGLLKMKPFVDAEATVIGMVELESNRNEAFKDELGHTKRSTAKAGKVLMDTMGALVCRTPEGIEFEIGTGFSAAERHAFWRDSRIVGLIVKYKSLIIGVKDKPRSAVFLGFRDRRDM